MLGRFHISHINASSMLQCSLTTATWCMRRKCEGNEVWDSQTCFLLLNVSHFYSIKLLGHLICLVQITLDRLNDQYRWNELVFNFSTAWVIVFWMSAVNSKGTRCHFHFEISKVNLLFWNFSHNITLLTGCQNNCSRPTHCSDPPSDIIVCGEIFIEMLNKYP